MWDVKNAIITRLYANIQGFTLTMWDVKQQFERVAERLNLEFYLNYVGCKVDKACNTVISSLCFTLLNYVGCKVSFPHHIYPFE